MLKKLFTLLFALLWSTMLLAQISEVDPNGETKTSNPETPGDILYTWDIDALTGETGNLGVEYAFGYLWVTSRGLVSPLGNKLTKIDVSNPMVPVVVDSFAQGNTDAWGWRDLCSDDTYLYTSVTNMVEQIDPATGLVVGSFPGVNTPNRALAYDPATDHFWTASFTSDLWEFDRTGAIINQFPSAVSMYGAAWDNYSAGGPYLWAHGDPTSTISQVDPVTGTLTGLSYLVSATGVDGGMSISADDLVPGKLVAVCLSQETPDQVFVVELGDYSSGGGGLPEVLYYLFDETGGTATHNYAVPGSGFADALIEGDQTMGPIGQFGDALIGSGSPGDLNNLNTGWVPDLGTSDWTISMYLNNMPAGTALNYLFGEVNTGTNFRCFYSGAAGEYGVLLRTSTIGGTDPIVPGVGPGPSVLTFVYDQTGPVVYSYINGVLVLTTPQAGPLTMTGTGADFFRVGGHNGSASGGLPVGSFMDEFRFYNRALDATEVAETWNISIVPVELTSFTASVNENDVKLLWETASEINNSGFQIERKSIGEYEAIGFVPGFGTTTEPKIYAFSDANLNAGTYFYRLKQIDYDGTFEYSDPVEVDIIVPDVYSLHQNYPNPFNPSTKITFTLAANANVSLKVFDVLGQEVMTLINQDLTAGAHTYDFDAAGFNSGVYFYRIEANGNDGTNFTNVKKMILLK